jgi:hypothetical protein
MTNMAMFWLAACNMTAMSVITALQNIAGRRPIISVILPPKKPAMAPPIQILAVFSPVVAVVSEK